VAFADADPTFIALLIGGLILTGAVAGVLAGLLGVGGGIVIVPVLYSVLEVLGVDAEVRMHVAVATSLATIIPTAIASARAHHRKGAIDIPLAKKIAPWNFVGAIGGAWLAVSIDGSALGRVFGVIALIAAIDLIRPRPAEAEGAPPAKHPHRLLLAPIATVIGFFSALMGIGGGTLAVPTLTYLGVPVRRAVATSALLGLVIAVPCTIAFVIGGLNAKALPPFSVGYVNLAGFVLIASITFFVAPVGTHIAHAISPRALRVVFALFLAITAVRLLLKS